MDVKKTIEDRRSVRKYSDREVSEELIDELIEAARIAPSAYNAQPWKFKILRKEVVEKIKVEDVFKQDFVYKAPLVIVCCCDLAAYPEKAKESFDIKELAIGDMGICSQNLVLRAAELGLGTCYIGLINRENLKRALNIPENYIIPYVIAAGWPNESPDAKPRKDKDEIIF